MEDGNELDMRYEPKSMSKIYLKFDLQHFIYFNTSDTVSNEFDSIKMLELLRTLD